MGKKSSRSEDKKPRASDFSSFHTSDSRPTGLHQIFASFTNIASLERNVQSKSVYPTPSKINGSKDENSQDLSETQGDILTILNKLTKKDSITKLKALEAFNEIIENVPERVLEEFLVDIIHIFKKLAIVEPVKKIRLELGILLSKISNKLKKSLQQYLDSFITCWWISMHDDSPEISEVYVEAFKNLFLTAFSESEFELRTLKILNFYFNRISSDYLELFNRDLDTYSKEWLDTFGKSSQNSASIADMHDRLFYSISHSLMKLFVYIRVHKEDYYFPLEDLITDDFVTRANEICRSNSFKKKLSCLLMLVEMVKVLPKQNQHVLEPILANSMNCVRMETETALIYHNVRLICACTRENNKCLIKILPSYDNFVVGLMSKFNGGYGNKVDLYTLFPSLYMYLNPDHFEKYSETFEKVLRFMVDLMKNEVLNLRRNSYTFDLLLYRNLGTVMMCAYYKLLLLSKIKSPEYITLPLKILLPLDHDSRDFLWHYPKVFTEYVFESNLVEEQVFTHLSNELLIFSEDQIVFIGTIFDNLFSKFGDNLFQLYPELEKTYNSMIQNVHDKFLDSLVEKLEKNVDLTVEIEQMAQLLKNRPMTIPHQIPALLFKSKSHAEFVEHYHFLVQLYRDLHIKNIIESLKEELDPKLHLFYCAVLVETDPETVKCLFDKKFELQDSFGLYIVNDFVNNCKGMLYSNELVNFAKNNPNTDLLRHTLTIVNYNSLSDRNKKVHETLLLIYQFYECKLVEFEGKYEPKWAESLLGIYLYLVLRKQICELTVFVSFVLDHFFESDNEERFEMERVIDKLDGLECHNLGEFEKYSKNLGGLLGTLFTPCFIVQVVNNVVNLSKTFDPSKLYKNSYYLISCSYMESEVDRTEVKIDEFLEIFVKLIIDSGSEFWVTVHTDLIRIAEKYGFNNEETYTKFIKNLFNRLLEKEYTTKRCLNKGVDMFKYFYKTLNRSGLQNSGVGSYIKSHFHLNMKSSYFLSSLYTMYTLSYREMASEINEFKNFVQDMEESGLNKMEKSDTYTFLNYMTLSTFLLKNSTNVNNMGYLELEVLEDWLNSPQKVFDNQDEVPHNEHIFDEPQSCHHEPDSTTSHSKNHSNLISKVVSLFFSANLSHTSEFSWAYLSLFDFLSLFSSNIHNKLKDAINSHISSCFAALYGSLPFFGVSTSLLTSLIKFKVNNGFVTDFNLDHETGLEQIFQKNSHSDVDLSQNLSNLKVSAHCDDGSLSYWLLLCLKFGYQSLKLEDPETLSDFSSTVTLLLKALCPLKPPVFYVNVFISRLWECRAFYPYISESGIFCNFPNHDYVCVIHNFPEWDFFYDLISCKIDFFKLLYLFNNYSPDNQNLKELSDEDLKTSDLNEEEESELSHPNVPNGENESDLEPNEFKHNIIDVKNGYDLMKLYFSLILGSYLTSKIMRTYLYLDSVDSQDIEKCLISWLTVFNVYGKYKRLGNINCSNALVKLLTLKPYEFVDYINGFQDNLSEAIHNTYHDVTDMSFVYSEQFKLNELYPDEYYAGDLYKNSLLDIFLHLLILCLEKMLIKDQEFCHVVKLVYYKAAKIFPTQVSEMWNNCKNSYVKKNIKKFTKHEVTQKLIKDELDTLKTLASDLTVFYDAIKKEVTAKLLTKNEITAKINIKVPSSFPLEPLTFVSQDTKKNHKWIIYSHSEANRSGIAQGVLLWYNNVVKYYEGIEECPICYSIVHSQFQSLPSKSCKVCKYKFHKECLFK